MASAACVVLIVGYGTMEHPEGIGAPVFVNTVSPLE